ncbi:hypothetical protein PISL3812_07033 [Talaromyces islandicus]|uniref:Alginate lyase 2 domain-containing protein n=1 Tax=Talaromyces islandicus TaxID=28573 RepID=A0A0U1M314_TALIS|nr:hypothetical protein PISL3812_07033 [Talaromyces islandicus]
MGFKHQILVALATASCALAISPVGSGSWKSVDSKSIVQECAGGSVSGNTFELPESPNGSTSGSGCSNGHLRAERRYKNDYSSGVHQFGGQFKITSMDGDRVSLKQTFNGDDGPWFILAVKNNGDLYNVEGGDTVASGVAEVGKTVTLNTVHDADSSKYDVYINGEKTYSTTSVGGSYYDKYGAYTTDSGSGPITVEWTDVTLWTQ